MVVFSTFEWNDAKDKENISKHGVSFERAQHAFFDPHRIIAKDLNHADREERFFCMGKVGNDVITVRFTYRDGKIRIFEAGLWRKGRREYEKK